MRKALLIADGRPNEDPNELDIYATQRLVEMYPAVVSRHFMIRVNALVTFMLNSDEVFCGQVEDYWWRIEFQNRGSRIPHLHMIVWIKDHPLLDTPEGLQRIDHVSSCELTVQDAELHDLVRKVQIHRHSHICGKKGPNSRCRFGYPRNPCAQTHMVDLDSRDFITNGGRVCNLKRTSEERYVNNYNPILLKLSQANTDILPFGSNETIAHYIAKYISKSEPEGVTNSIAQAIREIRREESNISRQLFRICMRILKERQVSACECVFRLGHLNLKAAIHLTSIPFHLARDWSFFPPIQVEKSGAPFI
ncbi:hypothetical protein AVEN_184280-1 [Araneus ventricosus]|uniref:Helitron helicase-like domain-containing protein n=1 Tax=Araneus ventricosus TaxID=182803 RepID=A0A4Y2L3J1_ARAVE|nr:hypothetical protein AVEN_184280-1 [Araneus ventricosus]